jgi:hypothetical protein
MVDTDIALNKDEVVVMSLEEKIHDFAKTRKSNEPFPKNFTNLITKPTPEELIIREEHDYTKFEILDMNREISELKAVNFAIHSLMTKHNYLARNPIVINSIMTPGKFVIFDGQHRFLASKLIRQPIYYLIDNSLTVSNLTEINRHQTNWKQIEFVQTFAKQGKPFYKYIVDLADKHPEIMPSTLIYLVKSKYSKMDMVELGKKFKHGSIEFSEEMKVKVEEFLIKLEDFQFRDDYKSRNFLRGFLKLNNRKNYSHDHMLKQIESFKEKFYKCVSSDGAFNMLKDVYNFHVKTASKKIK